MKKTIKVKKTVARKVPKASKVVTTKAPEAPEMPQNTSYWVSRLIDDKHQDWGDLADNWVEGYVESANHPHRDVILDILATLKPFSTLLEIGCSTGPNLYRINNRFPHVHLFGIDPNADVVERAQTAVVRDTVIVRIGTAQTIPYDTQSIDVILADASLMYITPEEILRVMEEINRIAKYAVVIVDRFNESLLGEVTGHVWGRNYTELLKTKGFQSHEMKMLKKHWPDSPNWQKYGRFFIGTKYETN